MATRKSLQPLSASGRHKNVMPRKSKPKPSDRPQFRPGKLIGLALHLYNGDTEHNTSQTIRMALKRFIPQKYFEEAKKVLNGKATA